MTETTEQGGDFSGLPGVHVTVDQIVAINLKYWRQAAQLTQAQLGTIAGLSKANISALERSAGEDTDPRRFDAQTIFTMAIILGVPAAAFFLPPPDDGISRRYLFEAAGECQDMAALVNYLISDPPDRDGSALAAVYEERYLAAVRRYTKLPAGEPDGWRGDLASAEQRRMAIEQIRTQRATLAGIIDALDRRVDAIADAGGLS